MFNYWTCFFAHDGYNLNKAETNNDDHIATDDEFTN